MDTPETDDSQTTAEGTGAASGEGQYDVIVVGGGVAGLTASIYTARHGLGTLVIEKGGTPSTAAEGEDVSGSILRRNAHLENYPGFPGGIDARLLLGMIEEQTERAGTERLRAMVQRVEHSDGGFAVETGEGRYHAAHVIAATKNETGYLDGIDGVGIVSRGKEFVDTDERGRTGVDGLYAAGRLAEKPHQAVVAAGHGAEVAVTLLEDHERPFYHDWVTPDGYFTDRGRDLPPGCEEIDDEEHRVREARSRELLGEYVADPHPGAPLTHPSLREE